MVIMVFSTRRTSSKGSAKKVKLGYNKESGKRKKKRGRNFYYSITLPVLIIMQRKALAARVDV